MNKLIIIVLLIAYPALNLLAQDKRGNAFVWGGGGRIAEFVGDTSRPFVRDLYPTPINANDAIFFIDASSNICDSATGALLLLSNGYVLYDTAGNIIDNGDHLVPNKIYSHNAFPDGQEPQGSIILPKGSNNQYYIFTPTMTDVKYDYWLANPQLGKFPFDLLQYHIVDMNTNGGAGSVVQKNIPLLSNVEMNKTGMQACKHANGYDWWLLKQGANTNDIYTFLVTANSVSLKMVQHFATPVFGFYDLRGQSCFSSGGTKYAFGSGGINSNGAQLFVSDFDRCTGVISNVTNIYPPIDLSATPLDTIYGPYFDSLITGVAFSPNDSFLYVNRRYNIYQYDMYEPNASLAWYRVQHGPDTSFLQFADYGSMQLGVDGRIYIGKFGGTGYQNSVIDYPNKKGMDCGFCRKCLRLDTGYYSTNSPANLPNFNLGASASPCWPLQTEDIVKVYPNPSSGTLFINTTRKEKRELYNSAGQLLRSTTDNIMDVSGLSMGVYYLRCGTSVSKVLIE